MTDARDRLKAVILEYSQSGNETRVVVSIGADDGLQVGTRLTCQTKVLGIVEEQSGPVPVEHYEAGILRVLELQPDKATCLLELGGGRPDVGSEVRLQATPAAEQAPAVEPAEADNQPEDFQPPQAPVANDDKPI